MAGFPKGGQAPLTITGVNPASVPATIVGAPGQTADLFDVLDSGGTKVMNVTETAGPAYTIGVRNNAGAIQFNPSNQFVINSGGALVLQNGAGTQLILQVAASGTLRILGLTNGLGNGASGNLTALAQGTGTGPASDVVNAWIPILLGAVSGWIPFFT